MPASFGASLRKNGTVVPRAVAISQGANADSVCAFLVFLDLLVSQTERIAELSWGYTELHAADPDTLVDTVIDCVWRAFLGHLILPLPSWVARTSAGHLRSR
jgi:hypothetical protein